MLKSRHMMPYDTETAKYVMKNFSEQAYAVAYKERFQAAVKLLYGPDFEITEDLSQRMQFACRICNREMNSENAMQEHFRSGPHQKNRDKRDRETGGASHAAKGAASQYPKDSLQYLLLRSQINPIGLQMIEEYKNDRGNIYYKCFLCGAHGKRDAIYHHIINKPHTEKYIKTSIELESNILTSCERETLKKYIIDRHGINVEAIKIIRGSEYYPKKWEAEGKTSKLKIKKERRSLSHSPSPARSKYSNRSPSPYDSKRKVRRDSRSPSRSYKKSPSRRRSRSLSPSSYKKGKGKSRSYKLSPGRSSRYSRSPESSRSHRERRRSSSSSQSSQRSQSPASSKHQKSRKGKDPWEDDQQDRFRNRSPPSTRVEAQSTSWAIPGPSGSSSISQSVSSLPMINTKDKTTQKVDLDDLMLSLNFLVKTQHMAASVIKTPQDVQSSLKIMLDLSKSLYEVINLNLDEGLITTSENKIRHGHQKKILQNMMNHLKKFMFPAAGLS